MDVQQAILKRRSVREYKNQEVPSEKLNKILKAAQMAPSAHNDQPWKFVVVEKEITKEKLAEAAQQSFIATAPVIIAAVALNPKKEMSCEVPSYAVNLAIAVDHMTLAATELGLGTCWIGAFSQNEVKRILEIPDQYKVVSLLPLGVPADETKSKQRKDLEEIFCKEKFQ
ncbi:MAG: nitroreductase family protein [Candidatus Paceibacterota bacterium]